MDDIDEMKVVTFCPLGKKCREIVDNEVRRCAWYIEMAGMTADGKPVDKKDCAIAWLPLLTVENSKQQLNTTDAVSRVNNTIAQTDMANRVLVAQLTNQPISLPAFIDEEPKG